MAETTTKKDLEALLEELKAENEKLKAAVKTAAKTKQKAAKPKGMVSMFIPLIDGEDDEITVGCNGVMYKIKRGVQVEVPHKVAVILQNSNRQAVQTAKYSDSVKNQELNA